MEDLRTVLTRRRLLQAPAGLLAGLVAGCRSGGSAPAFPNRPKADPDEPLRARVRAAERVLLLAYDATLARHPALRPALAPLRTHHAAHLASLSERSTAGSAAAQRTIRPEPVARDPALAVHALAAAERAAARARAVDCATASPLLAGLLASIGASEAAHAAVLPEVTRRALR